MSVRPLLQLFLLLGGVLIALGACARPAGETHADAERPNDARLSDLPQASHWQLAGSSRTGLQRVPIGQVTLQIEGGRIAGYGGCNQYSADYRFEGERLHLGPIAATKRACADDAVGGVEARYFEALHQATGFSRRGDALTMHLSDGETLEFHTAPPREN